MNKWIYMSSNYKHGFTIFCKEHNFKSKNNKKDYKTTIIVNGTTWSQSNRIFRKSVIISLSNFINNFVLLIVYKKGIDLVILLVLLNFQGYKEGWGGALVSRYSGRKVRFSEVKFVWFDKDFFCISLEDCFWKCLFTLSIRSDLQLRFIKNNNKIMWRSKEWDTQKLAQRSPLNS